MTKKLILGIDPARGWAVACNGVIQSLGTVEGCKEMKAQIEKILTMEPIDAICIERPGSLHIYNRPGQSFVGMQKIAHNVGMNFQKATELIEYCGKFNVPVQVILPIRGYVKLSHEKFCTITKWPVAKKTSEHSRDAGIIAWSRSS